MTHATHATDIHDIYRRHAEACLAVLTKTTSPTSQAMLTAMAHTWLRLAESPAVTDASSDEQYRRNADEALRRVSNARLHVQASWLRLADSWLRLLRGDEKPNQWNPLSKMVVKEPEHFHRWH
jgi:hypothetical protein